MFEEFFPKRDEIFEDYYFLSKGKEECLPNHSYGPMIRGYFLLHIVMEGKGMFRNDKQKFYLTQGQYFIIFPGENTYYEADQNEPWVYTWIGFNGTKVKNLLSVLGISEKRPVGNISNFEEEKIKINEIISKDFFSINSRLKLQGDFFYLLSSLSNYSHNVSNLKIDKMNNKVNYIEESIKIIHSRYNDSEFSIKDVSGELSLNPSYLTSIFRESTGRTMYEYLLMYRIQRSRYYLETTDLSISEVADKIGYKNPLSYTRMFKKYVGKTPSEYKNKVSF